jgi:hypothetical protein
LDTDLVQLIAHGASLGEARRRDYDKTVLGYIGFGLPRLSLTPVGESAELVAVTDAVRDLMLEGATGGVLFGDPAAVPFIARADEAPVQIRWQREGNTIKVDATCPAHALFWQCSDPTARWGKPMAKRVHARIPLGCEHIAGVTVQKLVVGAAQPETRVVYAFEQDRGEHFAQVKVLWEPTARPGDLTASFTIALTGAAARAKPIGGLGSSLPAPAAGEPAPGGACPGGARSNGDHFGHAPAAQYRTAGLDESTGQADAHRAGRPALDRDHDAHA